MEKRGFRYSRYALLNTAKYVSIWNLAFAAYLAKKRSKGKHFFLIIAPVSKKLVHLIFALEKSAQSYCLAA